MLLILLATGAFVAHAARSDGDSFYQILSRWRRSPAQSSAGLRAASTHQNCACQCSSLTFRDNWGELHGNCYSHDNGAQWCYTTGWGSSCRDKVKSKRFPNNPWSYEACSTPPISQCGGGCGGTCGFQGSSGGGYGGGCNGGGCGGGCSGGGCGGHGSSGNLCRGGHCGGTSGGGYGGGSCGGGGCGGGCSSGGCGGGCGSGGCGGGCGGTLCSSLGWKK